MARCACRGRTNLATQPEPPARAGARPEIHGSAPGVAPHPGHTGRPEAPETPASTLIGGVRRPATNAGFTLVELLIVLAIIGLLTSILLPTLGRARREAKAARCASNLRAVGQAIHTFAQAHDDYVAPVIRDRDYYWDRGEQIGWDIETGRWASIPGGPDTIWQCPAQRIAFVGNARALGIDNRQALPYGLLHLVNLSQWYEPARLVLAYDLQSDLTETVYAHALDPMAGDLSDESLFGWPCASRPTKNFALDTLGPHDHAYGALFGDGHARVARFQDNGEAVLWSGLRWWRWWYQWYPPGWTYEGCEEQRN